MVVNREKLYNLYMAEINKIADSCEDKSIFEPKEIIDIIAELIENNHNEILYIHRKDIE